MEILNKIQQELKAPKGQFNSFGKYNYRSCEDILEAVKPLLGKATLILDDEIVLIGNRYYVKAIAKLTIDKETVTATAYAREEETKKGMDGAQVTGASSSYARKYALNGLFCIDDTKDADTKDNTKEEVKPIKKTLTAFESAEKALNECTELEKLSAVSKKVQESTVLTEDEKKKLITIGSKVYDLISQ